MPEGVWINGKVLAELRTLAGMDQVDLANASCVHTAGCKLTETKISAYEREESRPTTTNLNAMVRGLKHAWREQGLEFGEAEQRALIRTPTLDAATSNGSTCGEDKADRRTAGKVLAVGSLTAVLAPSAALERIVTHGDRPVDAELIADHEDLADLLAARHFTVRPDASVGLVAHHADMLLALLDRPIGAGADRKRLEALAAGSCAQAAVAAFCLGDRTAAGHCFTLAREVAEGSGDDRLCAQVLGTLAVQHSPIEAGGGDSDKAVNVMRQAVHHARRADRSTRAYAHHWLALELAASGDEHGFFQSMQIAEHLVQRGQSEGHGFLPLYLDQTPEQVSGTRGIGLVRVGRATEAIDALQIMLSSARTTRGSVIALTDIAAALVLQNEPEEACATLRHALQLILKAVYPVGIERIRGVRARFRDPWDALSCVIEFDEWLRLTIASLKRQQYRIVLPEP